jgi:hypothetical protein
MPGPVSDSYDPEFGTGENCRLVAEQIEAVRDRIGATLRAHVKNIVEVVQGPPGRVFPGIHFTERELRVLRFALNRAIESM